MSTYDDDDRNLPAETQNEVTRQRLNKISGYHNLMAAAARADEASGEIRNQIAVQRQLCREDRFYLMVYILGRSDANNDWVFERCREVENEPDGFLDLWARYHYKSSILTFAGNIQEILRNPEETICILSYSKPMAEKFVAQIKQEFESNKLLQSLFPDVLYKNPDKEATKWSVKEGFSVRRNGNPKEQTVEGYGLVDSLPTGGHWGILHYDDIETKDTVTSPENIFKTITAWEQSMALVADNQIRTTRKRYTGTPYHHAGVYAEMQRRGAVKVRKYPATKDGRWPGEGVFLTTEQLREKYLEMGSRTFNSQMLMNPTPEGTNLFQRRFIRYHESVSTDGLNIYFLVDPTRFTEKQAKKKRGDYTVMTVIGLSADRKIRVLDWVRDKLTKAQKKSVALSLVDRWKPIMVFWEGGAQNSDVEDLRDHMNVVNYHFDIEELSNIDKDNLIPQLENDFVTGKILLPKTCTKSDNTGAMVNLTAEFEDELMTYPFGRHDDMINSLALMKHPAVKEYGLQWPDASDPAKDREERDSNRRTQQNSSWDALDHGL